MNILCRHVYIVDDDDVVRDGLVSMLERDDLRIRSFATAQQFLDSAPYSRPGCLILDLKLGHISGEVVHARLLKESNPLPVIVVTGYATVPVSVRLMEQGVVTLLEKPIEPQVLQKYVAQAIVMDQIQDESHRQYARLDSAWTSLSDRQRIVLELLVDGLPNKTIARKLGVSQRTVEVERSRLLKTFRVDSIPELVAQVTEYRILAHARTRSVRLIPVPQGTSGIDVMEGTLNSPKDV